MRYKALLLLSVLVLVLSGCTGGMRETLPEDLDTAKYSASIAAPAFAPEEVHTAEEGVVTIAPPVREEPPAESNSPSQEETQRFTEELTPDTAWLSDNTVTYHAFTLPEKTLLDAESGCIGVLSIPAISLCLNVYEAEDAMEAMKHGAAHYRNTSSWDGNIGISAHNGGVPPEYSFARLHELKKGDTVTYRTALGEREYSVTEIREISDEDWSWLSRTADNRLTMTTCISGKPDKRLMVQAVSG